MTVGAPLLRSAEATALTLADALERARAANPALRAAAADLEAARGRRAQAGLIKANPVLASRLARHTAPGTDAIDRGVELAQEVEVGGQRGLRIAAAAHDVTRAEHLLADRRRTVEAEVRRAYFGLAAAVRRHALATEAAAVVRRLADTARRRARAGDVGGLDVHLAEIEDARTGQSVAVAMREAAAAEARLAAAIGAGPDEALAADATADHGDAGRAGAAGSAAPAEAALVERALAARPDLAAAREEEARLETEAQLARRTGWVPNPVFKGFYAQEVGEERIVGGEISLPLPVWNREQGTETALRAAARAAATEADRLRREIPRQVRLALARRAAAADAWARLARDAMPAARAAHGLMERAYDAGYLGLPDLLAQQDRVLQVELATITAWLDLREAEVDLLEAVGEPHP